MVYRKSEHPRIVHLIQPRVLNFWDRSKMTPYHDKLILFFFVREITPLHIVDIVTYRLRNGSAKVGITTKEAW